MRGNLASESHVSTDGIREVHAHVRERQTLAENRTKDANTIYGVLSDHGITEIVKLLSVEGEEFIQELLLPVPQNTLLISLQ